MRSAPLIIAATVLLVTGAVNLELPLYARYAAEGGISAGRMSLLLAGYVGGLLPVLILLGGVSDRIGRRPAVMGSVACATAATLLVLLFPGLTGLAMARWLQGASVALLMGSATAWLVEVLGENGSTAAARIAGWTTTAGFGAGAIATTGALRVRPDDTPSSYGLWLVMLIAAGLALTRVPDPRQPDTAGAVLRLPAFPSGSAAPAIAIGLGWSVAGIVVSVLPGTLKSLGAELWAGPLLMILLATGVAAQLHARTLDGRQALRTAAVVLPLGTALLALGVHQSSLPILIAGAAVTGSASHGYGYLGGLTLISALPGSRARAISGYFLIAYLGFGGPAVAMGYALDAFTPTAAYTALAALITLASAALWHRHLRAPAPRLRRRPSNALPA